jgi:hypothetical protein
VLSIRTNRFVRAANIGQAALNSKNLSLFIENQVKMGPAAIILPWLLQKN